MMRTSSGGQLAQHAQERRVDARRRVAVHRRRQQVEVALAQRRAVADAARQRLGRERQRRRAPPAARDRGHPLAEIAQRARDPRRHLGELPQRAPPPASPSRPGRRRSRPPPLAPAGAAPDRGSRAWRSGPLHALCRRSSAGRLPDLVRAIAEETPKADSQLPGRARARRIAFFGTAARWPAQRSARRARRRRGRRRRLDAALDEGEAGQLRDATKETARADNQPAILGQTAYTMTGRKTANSMATLITPGHDSSARPRGASGKIRIGEMKRASENGHSSGNPRPPAPSTSSRAWLPTATVVASTVSQHRPAEAARDQAGQQADRDRHRQRVRGAPVAARAVVAGAQRDQQHVGVGKQRQRGETGSASPTSTGAGFAAAVARRLRSAAARYRPAVQSPGQQPHGDVAEARHESNVSRDTVAGQCALAPTGGARVWDECVRRHRRKRDANGGTAPDSADFPRKSRRSPTPSCVD